MVKKLRGTARPDRANPDEPDPPLLEKAPPCPKGLAGDAARREWGKVSRYLAELRVLTAGDLVALAAYCYHYQTWVNAQAKVAEVGAVLLNPKTGWFEQSPYLRVADDASDHMRRFMVEFGMTPASRSRVKAGKPPAVEVDDFETFLDRRNAAGL
ncbi:MAG TPA: phage terminase small subunit P27 family [Dehalococcoidia bacterium]|nr:phage terminase small subunit P27 family [Dehalococcoidia bacterium]